MSCDVSPVAMFLELTESTNFYHINRESIIIRVVLTLQYLELQISIDRVYTFISINCTEKGHQIMIYHRDIKS